jgi:hypothetical protein
MSDWIKKRLGIAEMNPESQSLAIRFFILNSTQLAWFQIISTFLVLFLLDIITYADVLVDLSHVKGHNTCGFGVEK